MCAVPQQQKLKTHFSLSEMGFGIRHGTHSDLSYDKCPLLHLPFPWQHPQLHSLGRAAGIVFCELFL